ncbi:DUF3592 domain-containing protein [Paraburkholderia sp. SOS3]|uniref:DUF3592 domain-containing protein n=1 Tax=Paraburkholderia sp. SOS3 TaxID=1926494 RepID=UPI000947533F|nr:DUF3592 domain-containing protein [Paraburkholderia sp. SOS3]APR34111.1 hypothetical protein BTO02_00380 [Paraburkholderia sp. SOS3]
MKRTNHFALAIGVCASVAAAISIYLAIDFQLSSVTTAGTVLRLNAGGHHPQIAFTANDGRRYERPTGTTRSFEAGQTILIRYRPTDPGATAMIDSTVDLWKWPLFVSFLAAAFVVTGLRGESFENWRNH